MRIRNRLGRLTLAGLLGLVLLFGACDAVLAAAPHRPEAPAIDDRDGPARIAIPPADGQFGNLDVEVAIDDRAVIGMETTPYWLFAAAGVAVIPMSIEEPNAVLGIQYPKAGPPHNAVFNARRDSIIGAVVAEPLTGRIVEAFGRQARPADTAAPARIHLRISGYGLVSRTGGNAMLLEPVDDLCLVARASLVVANADGAVREDALVVALTNRSADAPPPVCAPIDRFAADDASLLRNAILELVELIAAFVRQRLEVDR